MKGFEFGIEELRYAQDLFDHCYETFNQKYTAEELLKIARACQQSEWDFLPDQWEEKQIKQAIKKGLVPNWDNNEDPIYTNLKKIEKYNKK